MEKVKVIFLDVDGVLNPLVNIYMRKKKGEPTSSYHITIPGDKIYRLKQIVDRTGAILIMSSSWRLGYIASNMTPSRSYINLNNQLMRYGLQLQGWTPVHKDRIRGIEINWWLESFIRNNGYKPKYIIIDDELEDLINYHRGHIIKTTSLLGIQDEHVNIAVNLLNT